MKQTSNILPELADYPIYRDTRPLPIENHFEFGNDYEEEYDSTEDQDQSDVDPEPKKD